MDHALEKPPGILPRLVVVVVYSVLVVGVGSRVCAAAPLGGLDHASWPTSTESDDNPKPAPPSDPPPSFGFDARNLTGEKEAPYASDAETMAKWKTFQPTPPAAEDGALVYQNPAVRTATATPKAEEPLWRKWLLPGGITLTAILFAAGLLGWRMLAGHRAKLATERPMHYVPQSKRY